MAFWSVQGNKKVSLIKMKKCEGKINEHSNTNQYETWDNVPDDALMFITVSTGKTKFKDYMVDFSNLYQ